MSPYASRFTFSSYQDEDYIICEDMTIEQALSLRTLINQMTDEIGLCYGEKKGGNRFAVHISKLIITSNDSLPTEEQWPGFERRFTCIDCI